MSPSLPAQPKSQILPSPLQRSPPARRLSRCPPPHSMGAPLHSLDTVALASRSFKVLRSRKNPTPTQSRYEVLSSLRFLCVLCVSALYFPFLPKLGLAIHRRAPSSPAHSTDSLPLAAPPPSSTTDHSNYLRTRNTAPGRAAFLQPIDLPRALWLAQTWPLPKCALSICRPLLPAALRSLEFSLRSREPRVQLPWRAQPLAPKAPASR